MTRLDPPNIQRAALASEAIFLFTAITDDDDPLKNLLSCLMHYADVNGFNFVDELTKAYEIYKFQKAPKDKK